jgi:hypothetical protein
MEVKVMLSDSEVIEKYSKTTVGQRLKNKMYEIDCPEDLIADTLSCLDSDKNMNKMLDALNNGVRSEQDILLCCLYISNNMEIRYKQSIALSVQ